MNVKDYLQRIQYDGELNTDAETLEKLCDCHLRNIPFEAFDLFGKERKVLFLEKIFKDIVKKKRGGFCYENNGLFCWLLRKLGFSVDMMQAQAYIHSQQVFCPEFDHMSLMVTCSEGTRWLVDVGTAFRSFAQPLKFVEREEQVLRSGVYRIRKMTEGDDLTFIIEKVPKRVLKGRKKPSHRTAQKWEYVYKFTITPRKLNDFDEMCEFQHDESNFLKVNAVSCIKTQDGLTMTWGLSFCKKKYIDPYTEEIISVVKAKDEEEFKELIKSEMGIVIDFPLSLRADDFTGFTEEEFKHGND